MAVVTRPDETEVGLTSIPARGYHRGHGHPQASGKLPQIGKPPEIRLHPTMRHPWPVMG